MYLNEILETERLYKNSDDELLLFKRIGPMNEETTEKHLRVSLLDIDDFVKKNNCPKVTNPLLFSKGNSPTPDGLLSYELFGITKDDRAGIYGYIDLNGWFINPLCYKTWVSIDNRIRNIIHGTKKYKLVNGELIEDENGKTGINFLRSNFENIKIRRTESTKRDNKIKFIRSAYTSKLLFINKYIVIPPYYRDSNSSKNHMSVEGINKLYVSLLMACKSLQETAEYGFSMEETQKGRVQEIILNIYDYFCGNNNANVDSDSSGLARKYGIIRKSVLSKTTDYGGRNVLSASDLRAERIEDLMVDLDHAAIPVTTVCTIFYPFVLFAIRRIFDNWFSSDNKLEIVDKSNNRITRLRAHEPQTQFSDSVIKSLLKRFIHGYSNRITPIEVRCEDDEGRLVKNKMYLRFKGQDRKNATDPPVGQGSLIERRATWLDVFYMAAVEASNDKAVLATRFPIDSYFNQVATMVNVSSTIKTEPVIYNDVYYKWYPYIRDELIGSDTSNLFIDTVQLCNLHLPGMGADYDGDQAGLKAAYTKEAIDELIASINSKKAYANLGGINPRVSDNEAAQALYNLTLALPGTKLDII